ncbi:MAG: ATP-binding protein [Candidatus Micrarchaeota archaeon]|nr:ATP-binding protein [Candidatus Micrarchaeota archaeon]
MTEIKEKLQDSNPWWKGAFTSAFKEREIYPKIKKFLRMPQIIALTGLRRVGKTTIMLKIVEDALKDNFDPKHIIYFSFDDSKEADFRQILSEYEKLMEKNIREGNYLLLFDEVQKVDNWQEKMKIIYDNFGKNVKIILSGSESLFIRKRAKESLAGRIFEFKVEPLTFKEFLVFRGVSYQPIGLYEKELRNLFDDFILTMGFPELYGVKDKETIRKYIKDGIVDKIIYKDIPRLFSIDDPSILESLINIFTEEPGQIIDLSELGKSLGLSRQTISNYLSYLEQSFLLRKLYNFSRNRRKIERKLKKYYPTIISVNLVFRDDDTSRSKVFEWLLVNELDAEFFWRDSYKNEVDVVKAEEKILAMEIKYGKIETTGISAFMRKFKVIHGLILSYEKQDKINVKEGVIDIVPAWKFLMTSDTYSKTK